MEDNLYEDPGLFNIKPYSCMKRFKRIFRLVDLYALPITLRYKQEKRFYTNWGAMTSIFIIMLMLGFLVSSLLTMFADTNVTEVVTTKLIKNKDFQNLEEGNFIFGFRVIDSNDQLFEQSDILSWDIVTNEAEWNNATQSYSTTPTVYELTNCGTYYKEELNDTILLDETTLTRANMNSYLCPMKLKKNFVNGTKFEERYVSTSL